VLREAAEIQNLPPALLDHLIDRITEREISANQRGQFTYWLVTEPEVPEGRWFKRFPEMIVCGEGALVKTFLRSGEVAAGEEVI
jgi:hypothetical protein